MTNEKDTSAQKWWSAFVQKGKYIATYSSLQIVLLYERRRVRWTIFKISELLFDKIESLQFSQFSRRCDVQFDIIYKRARY